MSKHPAVVAATHVIEIMQAGSSKDGCDESWRDKSQMYHLSKAIAHLARHIALLHDPRNEDGENHAALALCRIAMCLSL